MTAALLLVLALAHTPTPATPGVTRTLTRAAVCRTRWGVDRRHVTLSMRKQVFAAYGIPWREHAKYEVDHLVPRELGGADDVANLWPQPWEGAWNARMKDRLENRLHRLVCAGTVSLSSAQQRIRTDWIAAYRRYVSAR
ncbi:MAG TPA: HNH endonuclease signature motif containing protein [Vicinamibacterales bacterium]|nr:HNH endonuclease signature motif containing protein [Vicinamibacterales bacterium]